MTSTLDTCQLTLEIVRDDALSPLQTKKKKTQRDTGNDSSRGYIDAGKQQFSQREDGVK
jgi:hypothetical protein